MNKNCDICGGHNGIVGRLQRKEIRWLTGGRTLLRLCKGCIKNENLRVDKRHELA